MSVQVRFCCLTLLAALVVPSVAHAQFWARFTNPTITVEIQHPPELNISVERIAFGPARGECSNEIVQRLMDNFVSSGIEIVDRQSINRLLDEHDLAASGYVDSATAAELGKLLGPSAMIMVEVQRCVTEQDRFRQALRRGGYIFSARTRGFITASIRAVDLATGTVFSARVLEHRPERVFESREGVPEFPSEFDVLNEGYALVVRDVRRMFLPWTEPRELVYFDDKDCGLNDAHQAMKNGSLERALDISLRNVEACEADPEVEEKDLGQAYYNVGMSYVVLGQLDEALEALYRSAELRSGDIVEEAISDTEQAKALVAAMRQVEEDAAFEIQERTTQAAATQANALTNADIVTMAQQSLPEILIIAKIESSMVNFDVTTNALVELNEAGVSPGVIMAMMSAAGQ